MKHCRKAHALRRRYGRSHGSEWKRVGIAFTRPYGALGRREEYGIYESPSMAYGRPVESSLYVQYEGYREGDRQVGLPLGGPSWRAQPKTDFKPEHFGEVRFFEKGRHG